MTGTPYQGTPLVYSLAGNIVESGLFVINSATGQISVAEGAVIDSSVVDSHRETEAMEGAGKQTVLQRRGALPCGEPERRHTGAHLRDAGDARSARQAHPGSPETSSETGNPGLDASWTAADGNGLTLTGYQVRYRKQGETEWTPHSGTPAGLCDKCDPAGPGCDHHV